MVAVVEAAREVVVKGVYLVSGNEWKKKKHYFYIH